MSDWFKGRSLTACSTSCGHVLLCDNIHPKREDRVLPLVGFCCGPQVLDWFKERGLTAYSISCGQSLLYNNIFPKHKERLPKKMSELVGTVAKLVRALPCMLKLISCLLYTSCLLYMKGQKGSSCCHGCSEGLSELVGTVVCTRPCVHAPI